MLPAVSKRLPLAAGVTAAFAMVLASFDACAAPPVTTCADGNSPGTLRYAVLAANEKETIDATQLQCTTITLQTGAININQNDLSIRGPGASKLTVDAGGNSRVFAHGGTGKLNLYAMTIANGHATGIDRALGGCVYSPAGSVGITDAVVTGCTATATGTAGGGGIFAFDDLFLGSSIVTGNTADSTAGPGDMGYAVGGGVFAGTSLRLYGSRIEGNHAHIGYGFAFGGGGYCQKQFSAKYSTIDGNVAEVDVINTTYSVAGGGGIAHSRLGNGTDFSMRFSTVSNNRADTAAGMFAGGTSAEIYDSTISGNVATYTGGGALVGSPLKLFNSTIAFNTAGSYGGGGLVVSGPTLTMSSTIIADNSPTGSMFAADFHTNATITGNHNLVRFAGGTGVLPMDTLRVDPMLDVLRDNGGATHTHALLPGSPAIDTGSNPKNLSTDQRWPKFDRVVGAAADIGAFEYDPDMIFISGFQ
jgi:hypothetical protein